IAHSLIVGKPLKRQTCSTSTFLWRPPEQGRRRCPGETTMSTIQPIRFGFLPIADWNQLVRLSRCAGFALDVVLGRILLGMLIGAAMAFLSSWNGPQLEQTQRRFDLDATDFKTALQAQLAQSLRSEPNTHSLRHQQELVSWLDRAPALPIRV